MSTAEIEKIFTEGKFEQLLSTIDLVKKRGGWGNEKVMPGTSPPPGDCADSVSRGGSRPASCV